MYSIWTLKKYQWNVLSQFQYSLSGGQNLLLISICFNICMDLKDSDFQHRCYKKVSGATRTSVCNRAFLGWTEWMKFRGSSLLSGGSMNRQNLEFVYSLLSILSLCKYECRFLSYSIIQKILSYFWHWRGLKDLRDKVLIFFWLLWLSPG